MALPTPLPDPTDWSAEVARSAEANMKANVSLYDSVSNPGAEPTLTHLATSKATIMTLSISDAIVGGQWITKRTVNVRIPLSAYAEPITAGLLLRVNDGHRDPTLEQYAFTVLASANSSDAAVRSIDLMSELVVVPAITP